MKGISQSSVSIHSRHSKRMRKRKMAACAAALRRKCASRRTFFDVFGVTASRRRRTGRQILTSELDESVCRFSCGCE